MKKSSDGQRPIQGGGGGAAPVQRSGRSNGFIPNSFRALSSYLRIVSSGASTVARSAASVASSIVDRDGDASHDQVIWAGYDKLECEGDATRRVLLLGYHSGFQVWDVEEADNVRQLVSRHDGPVSFMQMLLKPLAFKRSTDRFADSRPLLVVCADGSSFGDSNGQDGTVAPSNGSLNFHDLGNGSFLPTTVRFYSLRSQSFVHVLKFRSVVYSVRCSSRVVAVLQATQIHCFDASTLEREYTILTNPIVTSGVGSGSIGYGPLAVGPRWLAYSGSPVVVSNSGRVSPQHLTHTSGFPGFSSNGSLVAHYAKESSKQLAAGIVTLGDMGYKKLSRYCSELLPDGSNSLQSGSLGWKGNGVVNGHLPDADSIGMVIVRDIVSKNIIAQFRAHKSPISALCFDSSGTLLVTASVQGHNINVFKIMPGLSASEGGASCVHLYRLQRGFTNAVIQDISFSDDSNWIMISSSRGTCHLFAINPLGGSVNLQAVVADSATKSSGMGVMTKSPVRWPLNSSLKMSGQQSLCASGPPVTLSVVSRIRNGNIGWKGTVSGAAAAAAGRMGSLSGAIASSFHNCKGNDLYVNGSSLKAKYHLLVFSSSGCMIQHALRISSDIDSMTAASRLSSAYESAPECDGRLVVEALRKWNICQKQNRTERDDIDIYGDNGNLDSNKIYPEGIHEGMSAYPEAGARVTKAKISPEEKQHLYISEAELQMHQAHVPLWAKSEIYFQSMMVEGIKMDLDIASGGEIEIERIPTRMIEARSRDLVPVFDYLQTPKFQQERVSAVDGISNSRLLHPSRSGLSENGRLSRRSSSSSLDSMADSGTTTVAQLHNGFEETGWGGSLMPPIGTKGDVNYNGSPKSLTTRPAIVNNRDSLKMESQLRFVNNIKEGSKMEKHFEDERDEFG